MALRIVKATEPITVERINLCIYSQPGLGKTTLGFTADEPLNFDFDQGAHRAGNRGAVARVTSWNDATPTAEELAPYKTIVVDTAGRALDFLTADIIRDNPKMGRGGALTLQGYGVLKSRFAAWLKMLNTFGKDVVLIAHMDEQRNGDDLIERLDVQGGSKAEIYKSVDAMGRIFIRDKKRVLDFSPRENAFGKNPANLDVLPIPETAVNPHFLADVIAMIKAAVNKLSDEQKAAMSEVEEWCKLVGEFGDVGDFNRSILNPKGIKTAPAAAREFFKQRASKLGFRFDHKQNIYEAGA